MPRQVEKAAHEESLFWLHLEGLARQLATKHGGSQ